MQCTINFIGNPLKLYSPGETVEIIVELNVTEGYHVDEIYLKIFGQACCHFLSRNDEKTLTGCVTYIDKKISLLNLTEIQAGLNTFEANFQIPLYIPSSMESINGYYRKATGSIKYKVEVHVDSNWKPNMKFESPFTILSPTDLNELSQVINVPLIHEAFKNFTLDFSTKELYMSASIPRRGYAPGDKIFVTINVHNLTRTKVKSIRVSLNKIIVLTSQKPLVEVVRIKIVESLEYCDKVKPQAHRIFTKNIRVPAVEPNIDNCEVIKVAYELCVKAKFSGIHRSVLLNLPILIGTTRLRDEVAMRKYSYSSFETDI
ncbi:unnamed protein product [Chironomus riparius]|uniref:Arrestin C-terminal-like domain-containing protein n=1 Tax=Chironomus riparius TaxID=315576 RepID=A0A9N9S329_9DIPT|nr:unnamed protein product [Chironomus riparius]